MLTSAKIAAHLKIGTHGSTYGGNPLACAVGNAVMDVVNTKEVLDGVKHREQLFRDGLAAINAKYNVFSEVRGKGLLIGAVLNEQYEGRSRDFLVASVAEGLMSLMAGANVVRFAPSLVIPEADIAEGLLRFERAVAKVVAG
jgi:acetylornithine/N-succinyldiaminopimelate aminotransferase